MKSVTVKFNAGNEIYDLRQKLLN